MNGRAPRPRALAATAWRGLGAVALLLVVASLPRPGGAFAGRDPPIGAPAPDLGFFASRVEPTLRARCGACHAKGAGGFVLGEAAATPGDASRASIAAFRATTPFLDAEAPWNSRLLRKALGEDEGGLPHGGGSVLRAEEDVHDDLLDFAAGATLANLPPEPEPGRDRRIPLGEPVELDGSLSFDRDDDRLVFRWALRARPPGSRAALSATDDPRVSLRADVPGTYVATLRVFDGKAWSGAKPVVLECLERAGPTTPDAVADSGLASIAPDALRRVRAVYGDVLSRPPTPPEILSVADRAPEAIAATLLSTLEAGRALVEDEAIRLGLVDDAEPLSEAVGALPARIVAGEVSPGAVVATLARDPAFRRAHPPGDALLRAIATRILEREPTDAERPSWRSVEGLEAVLRGGEASLAAARRFARRFVPDDALRLSSARAAESVVALALAFVASPAWTTAVATSRRRAADPAFVRGLFADLLGRRPTSRELLALGAACRVLEGSGAGRAAVVGVVLDSGEAPLPLLVDVPDPDAWIADRFLRTLGRRPVPAEAALYRTALLDPAGGPHLVLRALLTSPEYASR